MRNRKCKAYHWQLEMFTKFAIIWIYLFGFHVFIRTVVTTYILTLVCESVTCVLYFLRRAKRLAMNWQHVSEHLFWLALPSVIPGHVYLHGTVVCAGGSVIFLPLMFTRAGRRLFTLVANVFTDQFNWGYFSAGCCFIFFLGGWEVSFVLWDISTSFAVHCGRSLGTANSQWTANNLAPARLHSLRTFTRNGKSTISCSCDAFAAHSERSFGTANLQWTASAFILAWLHSLWTFARNG